jgi:hypothetical protein
MQIMVILQFRDCLVVLLKHHSAAICGHRERAIADRASASGARVASSRNVKGAGNIDSCVEQKIISLSDQLHGSHPAFQSS